MSKLSIFKSKFRNFLLSQKEDFLGNKLRFILKICCWICFILLTLSVQLLTMLENYHLVPVVLTAIFGFFVFLYCVLYGKFVFNIISLFFSIFILYSFLITLFGSKDFFTFYLTQLKLTILMIIVFNFCINFYKPKFFLGLLIFLTMAISILFLLTSFKDIFSLNSATSESRIGNAFFGNVNYLGGALGSGVFFISIYICYYKKHYLSLLLFSAFLVFLILRTGSRMPFIIAIISLVFVLFYLLWRKHKIILFISIGILLTIFILIMTLPQFQSFSKRFLAIFEIASTGGSSEASANQRLSMQIVAIQFWTKRLFFGYGSSGFAIISSFGTYSHSTLCEILCDYGAVGCFLFYFPLLFFLLKSKKKTLSNVCFLAFTISQLIAMSLFGMLIYEKRFYIYIAIFASIFFYENKEKDIFLCIEKSGGFKFAFSTNIPAIFRRIKNNQKQYHRSNVDNKKRKVLSGVGVFAVLVLSFASVRIISSFSNVSKREAVAENISFVARNSTTHSANINVNPLNDGTKFSELDSLAVLCRNSNLNKTSVDAYNFRLIYDSKYNQKLQLDELEHFNPTMLVHTSSGTHKNENDENVFDWYELKMMFEGNHINGFHGFTTFIEIRETQAKSLLSKLGYDYSIKNCEEILLADDYYLEGEFFHKNGATPIKLKINNIILENEGMDNRYYHSHGDYIMISPMNFPSYDGYSMSFDFGTSFPETSSYLDYIETKFEREKYFYELNQRNLNGLENVESAVSAIGIWCENGTKDSMSDIVYYLVLSCILIVNLLTIGFVAYRNSINSESTFYLTSSVVLGFSISYIAFFVFSKLNIAFFQLGFSVSSSLLSLLLLIMLYILIFVVRKTANSKTIIPNDGESYQVINV